MVIFAGFIDSWKKETSKSADNRRNFWLMIFKWKVYVTMQKIA